MADKEIDLTVSPRWTDEQVLRARLAALETAYMVHGFVADGYVKGMLDIAEAFEAWLLREGGEPVDHRAWQDAPGPRCPTTWPEKRDTGQLHRCNYLPAHHDSLPHTCFCGNVLDASSVGR